MPLYCVEVVTVTILFKSRWVVMDKLQTLKSNRGKLDISKIIVVDADYVCAKNRCYHVKRFFFM